MGIQVIKGGSISAYLKLAGDVALSSSLVSVVDQTNAVSGLQLATASIGLTMPTFLALPNWTVTLGIKDGFSSQQTVAVASLGTGVFRLIANKYTINNTAAQTGSVTGYFLNATETALNGITHNLMDLQVGGVSQIIVKSSGFVGIGTSTPSTFFEVLRASNGAAYIKLGSTGNNETGYQIYNNGALKWQMYNANSSNDLRFFDGDIRVVFKSGGDVGIGTVLGAVSARLHVKGSGTTSATTSLLVQNSAGNRILQSYDDRTTHLFDLRISAENTYNNWGFRMFSGGAGLGYIQSDSTAFGIPAGVINIGTRITVANTVVNASSNNSSIFEIFSTTQGFLPPRMTTAQVNAIVTPAEGLVVFNTTISHLCVYQAAAWVKLSHSPM